MMTRRLLALFACLALPSPAGAGSNSLLALKPDGSKLVAANTDAGTASVVDLKSRKLIREFPVGDRPEGAAWVPGTETALVTLYNSDGVAVVDTAAGRVARTIPVADEPYGVVVTADGRFAYVSHDYPGTISEIDVVAGKVTRTFRACPEGVGCRGIALTGDDKTLYATEFFSAALVGLDRATGKVAGRWAGDPQDNLARHVELHPRRAKAYLAHTRDRVTGFDARGSVFPHVSFCDLAGDPEAKRRRTLALDTYNGVTVVTNPWESALSPDGSKLYTVYASTDDANVSKTIDDDYQEIERLGRVRPVGKHPRAVRVAPDGGEVYVYATLDHALNVFDPTLTKKLASIPITTPAHTAEWRRGKELFHAAGQPMGSARWISCSSCHPDGLHDGRVWQNPEGPRKTPNLFGMAHTHPLHWSGDRDAVRRETMLPGAVLVRVAASHLRVGTFEFAALQDDPALLRRLTDYAIARHHPEAGSALELLERVVDAQARLIARWMAVGFVHGVMNTDNMAISGETIDYGPCAFMEAYDPRTRFSSIDHGGRYAYGNQPLAAQWNLARFAEALLPLIDDDVDAAVAAATPVLEGFTAIYDAALLEGMRAKLGLSEAREGDAALVSELRELMAAARADWTQTFRGLSEVLRAGEDGDAGGLADRAGFDVWIGRWRERVTREGRRRCVGCGGRRDGPGQPAVHPAQRARRGGLDRRDGGRSGAVPRARRGAARAVRGAAGTRGVCGAGRRGRRGLRHLLRDVGAFGALCRNWTILLRVLERR